MAVGEDKCPRCGFPFHAGTHVCINKIHEGRAPQLSVASDSEVCAHVDFGRADFDGVFRPVILQQDDGSVLALTIKDAERIYHFLDEALPFLEGKVWTRQ